MRSFQVNTHGAEHGAEGTLSDEHFVRLRDLLEAYSGVYVYDGRRRLLEIGLSRRLEATGDELVGYARRVASPEGHQELRRLAELVLNHETYFFRNKPHMQALQQTLLPELHRRKPAGASVRVWSAGCATGEEPYSLAIVALETFGRPPVRPVEILATDLSETALERARTAIYNGRSLGNLPPELQARYFHPRGGGLVVCEEVRRMVRFVQLNLLDPFPAAAGGVDVIFCQNVMIYFQLETSRRLLERFHTCLADGGVLCLGFSETLWNVFNGFHTREVDGAYVYYKGAYTPPDQPTLPTANDRGASEDARVVAPPQPAPRKHVTRRTQAALDLHTTRRSDDAPAESTLLRLAEQLLGDGRTEQAIDVLSRIAPQSSEALRALILGARAHAGRGDLDLALAEARRAIELDPMCGEAYMLTGAMYSRQGEWPAAARAFERARYLNPASALISFHLADAYRHADLVERALHEYQSTLRKLEPHPPDELLEGVAVAWLQDTCRRQIEGLSQGR